MWRKRTPREAERRRQRTRFALFALVLVAQAHAYVIDTDGHGHDLHWNHFPVEYHLVSGNNPQGASGEPAVHAAFQTWSDASSAVQYQFGGYVDQAAPANDGKNVVYWVYDNGPYDPSLAAITFRYFDTSDGHILDADIIFDGEHYDWSVGGSQYDIQNSATHEVGHFGDLGHSLDAAATMYANTTAAETSRRTLSNDDVAIEVLYGGVNVETASNRQVLGTSASSSSGASGGGCSLASPSGIPARPANLGCVVFVLASLALRRRSIRRR